MILTIEQCNGLVKALMTIKNSNNLSFNFAWQLDDNLKELKKHNDRFLDEQLKLLTKYGKELEHKKGSYTIPEENQEAYKTAIDPILKHEVEVKLSKFTLMKFRMEKITIPAQVDTSILRLVIDE